MLRALILTSLVLLSSLASAQDNPIVEMQTNKGRVVIELWADQAPVTVENFLRYVDAELYDGLIFHRVIPGFMIQGGGYDEDMVEMSTFDPIKNEAKPSLKNDRSTLAMARTGIVDSATSQFFINLVNNDYLNQRGTSARDFGYAVFGAVVEGMEVIDEIATVPTVARGGHQDVPMEPVVIESIRRVTE